SPVKPGELPDVLTIEFPQRDQHYDADLKWNEDGTAETDWKIPQLANLGDYEVTMSRRSANATPTPPSDEESATPLNTGSFRVEEFSVPLLKASIRAPSKPLVAVTRIPIDVSAEYLSGGPAKGLPVTLRSQIIKAWYPNFADFEGFSFANGAVKTGIVR